MSEEKMAAVEVIMVGKYARGCKAAGIDAFELLTAVGVDDASASSKIKAIRVMGGKHKAVLDVGFARLAIFKPGMIVGNAHTPRWMTAVTRFIPDSLGWGNITQNEVARAFVAHLKRGLAVEGQAVVSYGNKEMKGLLHD